MRLEPFLDLTYSNRYRAHKIVYSVNVGSREACLCNELFCPEQPQSQLRSFSIE